MSDTLVNANALFQGLKVAPSFHKKINIAKGDPEDRKLMAARQKLRSAIRDNFSRFDSYLQTANIRDELLEARDSVFEKAARQRPSLRVRFMTQGSYAYELLNRCAQQDQEIDLDDGVYIPMPFISGRPMVSSKGLFTIVEEAIKPLLQQEGWGTKRKNTCLRVLIGGGAHIDLPLYAVDENDFDRVDQYVEKAMNKSFGSHRLTLVEASRLGDSADASTIQLAHRKDDWVASDPKEFADWFTSQVDLYGPSLKRVIRYLKAWRDEIWLEGELKSMAIMIICVELFAEFEGQPQDERDDVLVLEVVRRMPERLKEGDIRWTDAQPALDQNWSVEQRDEIVSEAKTLRDEVETALTGTGVATLTVRHLRNGFGKRFPNEPDSVQVGSSAKIDALRSSPATTVKQPVVGSSISG